MMRADRDVMGHLRDNVELFDCDLINLVHDIESRTVLSVALNGVNDVIDGRIAVDSHLRIHDPVLLQHGCNGLLITVLELIAWGNAERQAALLPLLEQYRRRLLVQADPEALQLVLDLPLVHYRLHHVQDDEDEAAAHRGADDLLSAALAILGPLDDAREVEQLYLGALVVEDAGHACEGRELVGGDLALLARHLVQQRGLAHGGEADKTYPGIARLGDLEARSGGRAPAAALRALRDDLCPKLGQLRLEQPQVRVRRLVLLRPGHLVLYVRDLLQDAHGGGLLSARARAGRSRRG
mmetsp:Transcript_102463/g.306074  ORF Transcript_102463/g.306074 Transcript_102463/m.306074 type:complete len:296 (+) Transcript_102463:340-1227(+)